MREKIILRNVDDFFKAFTKECGFSEKNTGSESRYEVAGEQGRGLIQRLSFNNGIAICIEDVCFKENIIMHYKMDDVPFEVSYCISGRINHFEEELGNVPLNKGCVGIYMKNGSEGWMEYPCNSAIKCISVSADSEFMESFKYGNSKYNEISSERINCLMKPQKIDPSMRMAFEQMYNCCFHGLSRLIYLQSKAMEVISLTLHREINERERDDKKSPLNSEDRKKIQLSEKIILENLTNPLSIKELSLRVGLNTCKLKEGFKQVYGNTIFGYIKDVRMEKARRLLLEQDEMNVNDIVNEIGYSNSGHFARAFRQKYGINPKKFRLRI